MKYRMENKYYLSDEKLENEWDGKFQLPNDKNQWIEFIFQFI